MKRYICDGCGKRYASVPTLEGHYRKTHGGGVSYSIDQSEPVYNIKKSTVFTI